MHEGDRRRFGDRALTNVSLVATSPIRRHHPALAWQCKYLGTASSSLLARSLFGVFLSLTIAGAKFYLKESPNN